MKPFLNKGLHDPLSQSYHDALNQIGVEFEEKDIDHLHSELFDSELVRATKGMTAEESWQHILNTYYENEPQPSRQTEINEPVLFKYNLRAQSLPGIIKEFQENESRRIYKRVDQKVEHVILSWNGLDKAKLTNEIVTDIVQKYISIRGQNSVVTGTIHTELDHLHVHLAVGAQLNGLSSRVSKQRFQEIKMELQKFQQEKYPELFNSVPKHKSIDSNTGEKGYYKILKNERTPIKNELIHIIENNKPSSTKELTTLLVEHGYEPYERGGKVTGIMHSKTGLKFRISRLPVELAISKDNRDLKKEESWQHINELQDQQKPENVTEPDKSQNSELEHLANLRESSSKDRDDYEIE